jgi:hypothetical protein
MISPYHGDASPSNFSALKKPGTCCLSRKNNGLRLKAGRNDGGVQAWEDGSEFTTLPFQEFFSASSGKKYR